MKTAGGSLILSAYDLVGHLNCHYLTQMDIAVAKGTLPKPQHWDPLLDILRERGLRHEQAYLDHLAAKGFDCVSVDGVDITDNAVAATLEAMQTGVTIIVQGALRSGRWEGRADALMKVEKPSSLGNWSYEIVDTKLARETKGGTVLQLSLYADLLTEMQGVAPDYVYVVAPWSDFERQEFRVADYAAFYRKAKRAAEVATEGADTPVIYPDPKAHCDICRWADQCDARRREDDHLCLVANISKSQINELHARGIQTTKALSELPSQLPWKPDRGSPASYEKAAAQARIQVEAREAGALRHERLDVVPGTGLTRLPEPSEGDIFFDIEGDPFIGEAGLEYLFGYRYRNEDGESVYLQDWAFDRASEKEIFERFMDFVTARREAFPDLHIYHYAHYEPDALKRLMGRYATRQTEVDNLLRGGVLVDLLNVVRNAIRASVESYSIKKLEPFYGFERATNLKDANIALTALSAGLELDDAASITDEIKAVVASYNDDDCCSTEALRDWLEDIRAQAIADGISIGRPEPGQEDASEDISEHEARINALIEVLTHDVPIDPEDRTGEQHARWILAHTLDWHRREEKAVWWEYFRLRDLKPDELMDEKAGLGNIAHLGTIDKTVRGIPTDRYSFPQQDTDIREADDLHDTDGNSIGKVETISQDERTIDIKKTGKSADIHPAGLFSHTYIRTKEQVGALLRLGDYVAANGIEGEGPLQAARDLLLRYPPRLNGESLHSGGETTLENALRVSPHLNGGGLPIQGPPGTGKSFTGAHMIYDLIAAGKTVGITANSHKVIRNLIDKAIEVSVEASNPIRAGQKLSSKELGTDHVEVFTDNGKSIAAVQTGAIKLLGGTSFFWAREDVANLVDVIFVDEAAQMSLANVLAVSQAAPQIVLLGDPQQLDQPTRGSHPDGTGVSALDHILGGKQTIESNQGLFLEQTWRLHPDITVFNSELFYESKLTSEKNCERQSTASDGPFTGTGLRYVPVEHSGNQSSSTEEAEAVKAIVDHLLGSNMHWTNRQGETKPIELSDIITIAPYNAQVFEIQQRLPGSHVGTVDKFQGQEAAIAIYSTATSSHADAPRGMEFLYSANRLNVAISRAKCMAILVASPQIFEAECRTPRQMRLANAFCRYLELAETVSDVFR